MCDLFFQNIILLQMGMAREFPNFYTTSDWLGPGILSKIEKHNFATKRNRKASLCDQTIGTAIAIFGRATMNAALRLCVSRVTILLMRYENPKK